MLRTVLKYWITTPSLVHLQPNTHAPQNGHSCTKTFVACHQKVSCSEIYGVIRPHKQRQGAVWITAHKTLSRIDLKMQTGLICTDLKIQRGLSCTDLKIETSLCCIDLKIQKGLSCTDMKIEKCPDLYWFEDIERARCSWFEVSCDPWELEILLAYRNVNWLSKCISQL